MFPKLSVIINIDNRPENLRFSEMNKGVVHSDFWTHGVYSKVKFFDGFPDKEIIVNIDEHSPFPEDTLRYIRTLADTVLIRKHTEENCYNDYNYLRSLYCASGDIICKIDQDTACFTSSPEPIQRMIDKLEDVPFVSYPSSWSPKPVIDESFAHRTWASTRFFICKREALKFEELKKCLLEPEYAYATYGDSPRKCNWLEHFLTLVNGDQCYYPPIDLNEMAIFCFGSYDKFILQRLNELPYDKVKEFILSKGGIQYPNDVYAA